MTENGSLPDSTPIVVGAAEVVHRPGSDFEPCSATELLLETVRAALDQTGSAAELGRRVGEVLVPHGTWVESDPGRAIAVAVGSPEATSVRSELGVLQHTLLVRAITAVAEGRVEVAIVAGGENRWSGVHAAKSGGVIPDPPSAAIGEPDEVISPAEMVISAIEIERNLTTAAHQYAVIESGLRHCLGRSIDEHQRALGNLWEGFAAVAAQAPGAWNQQAMRSEDIAIASESNRVIASPYTKWLISQWNVDQAAALVVTTVGVARELGIDEERWVFPLATGLSNLVIPMPERDEIHRWPASGIAGRAALDIAGVTIDEVDLVDLYSCFPAAVEVQARELGFDLVRPLTITGGMTFAGGPYNNYSLQGAAAMVTALTNAPENTIGLTSAVSGLLTKPSVTLWSNAAPRSSYACLDVTEEARNATSVRTVDPDLVGPAVIVGATVVPGRSGELTTIAVVESAAGIRSVVQCTRAEVGERFLVDDPVGISVICGPAGEFRPA
jgi:acetyl-CoA C-acetyltransferase